MKDTNDVITAVQTQSIEIQVAKFSRMSGVRFSRNSTWHTHASVQYNRNYINLVLAKDSILILIIAN